MSMKDLDTFTWKGQTRYKCPDCGFDAHDPVEVVKHWKVIHGKKSARVGGPTLFDAKGEPLDPQGEIYVPEQLQDIGTGSSHGPNDSQELSFGGTRTDPADREESGDHS